jgi:hypothetical protein
METISIDSKLTFMGKKINAVNIGNTLEEGFKNLIVKHVIFGSWLGKLFILCFRITGVLAVLTWCNLSAKLFSRQGMDWDTATTTP